MLLNEYNIVKGGSIFTKLDDEAHRFAKLFAESKGYNLQEKALLTKRGEIDFIHPIEELRKMDFRIDSSVRFDKNHNISVYCYLFAKQEGKIGAKAHLTFAIIDRNTISGRKVGVIQRKEKSKIKE